MSGFLPEEQQFLDEAFARLQGSRRTFTESVALQQAWSADYQLSLNFDERFVKAQPGNKAVSPHYRLREHRLANQRLVSDLLDGSWDGVDLDSRLAALDEEEGGHHVFYPHDTRLKSRQGRWEAVVEVDIPLEPAQKSELDALLPHLLRAWDEDNKPCTLRDIEKLLVQADWPEAGRPDALKIVRSWLSGVAQLRRVGQDSWLPVGLLPAPISRTRLQVLPVRTMRSEEMQAQDAQFARIPGKQAGQAYLPVAPRGADPVIVGGEVTNMYAQWATTLRTVNIQEGFLTVPAGARAVYPLAVPQPGAHTLLEAMWHEDGEHFILWLDRRQHLLYGPDLLAKIAWGYAPGDILRIVWASDVLTIFAAGHDEQVAREEARLIDPACLKNLRGGLGENYRDSLQGVLRAAPEGLTRQKIEQALAERLGHTVHHGTVLALLSCGGFMQRDGHWFAASDEAAARRALRAVLVATLLPPDDEVDVYTASTREQTRRTVKAIVHRLEEIERSL
ncbi:MAG TPA: hypothetical protein VGF67_04505 [Ktedonobacteraceae bacterium]|jgi:hypothetical protein